MLKGIDRERRLKTSLDYANSYYSSITTLLAFPMNEITSVFSQLDQGSLSIFQNHHTNMMMILFIQTCLFLGTSFISLYRLVPQSV